MAEQNEKNTPVEEQRLEKSRSRIWAASTAPKAPTPSTA